VGWVLPLSKFDSQSGALFVERARRISTLSACDNYFGDHWFFRRFRDWQRRVLALSLFLRLRFRSSPGPEVESKDATVAIHYRRATHGERALAREAISEVLHAYEDVRLMKGKKVCEILPRGDVDKWKAILVILDREGLNPRQTLLMYLGDDMTDEAAFREMRGISVFVGTPQGTCAAFYVESRDEVREFLEMCEGNLDGSEWLPECLTASDVAALAVALYYGSKIFQVLLNYRLAHHSSHMERREPIRFVSRIVFAGLATMLVLDNLEISLSAVWTTLGVGSVRSAGYTVELVRRRLHSTRQPSPARRLHKAGRRQREFCGADWMAIDAHPHASQ
jgi:hypothetical protein